jgi:hypothetical protein
VLESLSKTMRTYVTSSIRVPSAAPSSPRVSRPVSFGSFMSPGGAAGVAPDSMATASDEGVRHERGLTVYPTDMDDDGQTILWAKWDTLPRAGQGSM